MGEDQSAIGAGGRTTSLGDACAARQLLFHHGNQCSRLRPLLILLRPASAANHAARPGADTTTTSHAAISLPLLSPCCSTATCPAANSATHSLAEAGTYPAATANIGSGAAHFQIANGNAAVPVAAPVKKKVLLKTSAPSATLG